MAHEPHIAGRWLDDTLRGDALLMALVTGVYRSRAPQGTALPYVVWDIGQGSDTSSACDTREVSEVPILVKIVSDDRADPTSPQDAVGRVDALLTAAKGSLEGYRIAVKSGGAIGFTEDGESNFYRHEGRLWRFRLMPEFD